ncbi:MAG: Tad domain-containing protein, partial [Bdellovibrionales bacterium]|nr:Tad domain-containing protein [Bdellovibrionales bacterium]
MINKSSKLSNEKGQLTIFMGIAITIIFSCLAFMVNVGLFVKAKINLQNAVDAAAWSGAAVQARQLSKIGYLNWEIRNVYKEWMFKYYVVGQLANSKVASDTKTPKDFRPKVLSESGFAYDADAFSKFNAPSICIHFDNDSFNICAVAGSPGLPRFGDLGIAGVAESQKAFVNDMVANKANDCSRRTDLNFGTAMIWAYGAGGTESGMQSDAPKIAADRMGAWPKSLEIALRMRNLEYIVNRPPVDQPICMGGSSCKTVQALASDASGTPLNERPVKAFMSAYRNLSGGYDGESQDKFQDLK